MLNASGGRLLLRRVSSDFNGRASPRVCSPGPPDGRAFVNALGDDSRGKWQRSGDGADYATATNTPNDSTRFVKLIFVILLCKLPSVQNFLIKLNGMQPSLIGVFVLFISAHSL